LFLALLFAGCASPTRNRAWVDAASVARTGHRLGARTADDAAPLPPDVSPADGIDPDEAASIALWRNPGLQAELSRLDVALADVDEASRWPNPRLSFLAPLDPRQLALILAWPIDAIWQMPARSEAATRELESVAETLVQTVLDLERTIRLAHADAWVARARAVALAEVATTWQQAATLALARARAGDISLAEASSAEAEAIIAKDAVARAWRESTIADVRLLAGLAVPWSTLPHLVPSRAHARELPEASVLVARAISARPDLHAAALAVHAAAARARWERSRAFALVATLDGQAPRGGLVPRFSVGAQLDVPLFSMNQGGIGRAEAAVARAGYLYLSQRLAVTAEVVAASEARERARSSFEAYGSALRALGEASIGARKAFDNGGESYLFVIDATRREAQAQLTRIDLEADLARAEADLARAVGGRLPREEGP
jgi:outer membrane protein TolC